jgi:hypothetical protein
MNLDNLNLVELNAQEAFLTDGGYWGESVVKSVEHAWNDFCDGVTEALK